MNRTQTQRVMNPNSTDPSSAGASIASGRWNRPAKWAPAHNPKNEAPQAQSGVRSHPMTTSARASQRGNPAALTRYAFRTLKNRATAVSVTV